MSGLFPSDEDFLLDESSVLAFLEDFDMDDEMDAPASTVSGMSALVQSDTLSSSPNTVETPTEKKPWRLRRKEEVSTLKRAVKQLSAELELLKLSAGVHSTLPTSMLPKVAVYPRAAHRTELSVLWEQNASRQSMLRLRSERENAQLREVLRHQQQQAKSLRRAVKRKLREDLMAKSMDLTRSHRLNTRGVTPPLNNKAAFDQLMVGLDAVYDGVDAVFERVGMAQLPCPGRRNNSSRAVGKFVEFLDNNPLPFDLRTTAQGVWTMEKNLLGGNNVFFLQNFTAGSNTHMKSFCFAQSVQGLDFRVVMRSVMRKYVEKNRIVFIKRTLMEPVHEKISLTLVETSRVVLECGKLSVLGPTTMMHTHRDAEILGGSTTFDIPDSLRLGIGLQSWENSIVRYNNSLEDQLVRTAS